MSSMRSLKAYDRHYNALIAALHRPNGLIVRLPDNKSAIRWRQQANQCRRLDRIQMRDKNDKIGASAFDVLELLVEDRFVIIRPRQDQVEAFIDPDTLENVELENRQMTETVLPNSFKLPRLKREPSGGKYGKLPTDGEAETQWSDGSWHSPNEREPEPDNSGPII